MCLLIAFYNTIPDYPVIIGVNREELYSRPSLGPQIISQNPKIIGGIDKVAGGTWLGLNEYGVVVGITNRSTSLINSSYRSRGLLCLDMLEQKSANAISRQLTEMVRDKPYNPFHLFYGDFETAHIALYENGLTIGTLKPGIHIITTAGFNDDSIVKVKRVYSLLWELPKEFNDDFISILQKILRDHEYSPPTKDSICAHGNKSGTVSSTILVLNSNFPQKSRYYFSEGPPCLTQYMDYPDLMNTLKGLNKC